MRGDDVQFSRAHAIGSPVSPRRRILAAGEAEAAHWKALRAKAFPAFTPGYFLPPRFAGLVTLGALVFIVALNSPP